MKKHLIAAAVAAAVAVPAAAQVSIYGQLDVSYGSNKAGDVKTTGLADDARDSSRIGFRGTEDLGSGLKAGFVYEVNLDMVRGAVFDRTAASATDEVDDGSTAGAAVADRGTGIGVFSSTRQAFANLAGGFGDVKVGYKKTLETDFNDAFMIGTENSAGHQAHTFGRVTRANGFYYTTPSISGLTASLQYTAGKQSGNATDIDYDLDMTQIGLNYSVGQMRIGAFTGSGKFDLGAALTEENIFDSLFGANIGVDEAGSEVKYKSQGIGGSYDLGVARVAALIASRTFDMDGDEVYKNKYQSVSVAVPMGAITLTGAISQAKETEGAGSDEIKTDGNQLIANYAFSKRTSVYALYGKNKESEAGEETKTSTYRFGIAHSF
jgi:predicted porin